MKHIDIVIINWNAGHLLAEAVNSIFQSNYELTTISIIVIDNASSDDSLHLLPLHPSLHVIQNKENIGFASACNQGFIYSKGDYFLLLNPDTRLFADTLLESVRYMEHRKDISILGVRHLDDEKEVHPSCSHFPKPIDFVVMSLGLHQIAPTVFRSPIVMTSYDYKKEGKVDQVMGAYMFMRRSDIEKYKLQMDERFFVYYEDLDFSKRLHDLGGISYYVPTISIVHKVNGTTDQIKGKRLFYSVISRLQYCKKHFGYGAYSVIVLFSLFIEPFTRILYLLITRKVVEIKEILKGYKMVYSCFFRLGCRKFF